MSKLVCRYVTEVAAEGLFDIFGFELGVGRCNLNSVDL